MQLSSRSSVFQLFLLFIFLVVVVTWYRGYLDETTRAWYERVKPQEYSNGLSDLTNTTNEGYPPDVNHESHASGPDGLLRTNMLGRHPLWQLLEDAERQWKELNTRQSTTLAEAVAEYKRRNGYPPPAGFDLWWEFTQKHNVKLVDEFDQINYDITPYLALSSSKFRERVDEVGDPHLGYHLNITNGHVGFFGPKWNGGNQMQFASMLMGFSRALPDLVAHGQDDIRSDMWIGEDLRQAARAKAKAGQYFTDEELQNFETLERNPHTDRKNMCLPDDPVFTVKSSSDTPTFISSHLTSMSPCSNPLIHHAPPILFSPTARPPRLKPRFVFSKHRPDCGLLVPSNMWEYYDPLLEVPHTWEERHGEKSERLFWQGLVTGWNWSKNMGSSDPSVTWRDGVRPKFALKFGANVTWGQEVQVLVESASRGTLEMKTFDRAMLNEKWMDVSLTSSPIQCVEDDGTCDEMRLSPIWKEPYPLRKKNIKKFVADLDTNAWSDEFQRKLSWGNVVFKSTAYPEWNTQWLIPYYHYIPIQADYSDVYNVMAFFLGDPETGTGGHEEVAAKISRQASSFVREYWRWEDMQAYLYRLMLEYVRLGSDDRESASYRQ